MERAITVEARPQKFQQSDKSSGPITNTPSGCTKSFSIASRSSSVSGVAGSPSQNDAITQPGLEKDLSFDLQHLSDLKIAVLEARKASLQIREVKFDPIHQSDVRSPYFPYPQLSKDSYFGNMQKHVGGSAVDSLHLLPVESSRRNAELLTFCKTYFEPF